MMHGRGRGRYSGLQGDVNGARSDDQGEKGIGKTRFHFDSYYFLRLLQFSQCHSVSRLNRISPTLCALNFSAKETSDAVVTVRRLRVRSNGLSIIHVIN